MFNSRVVHLAALLCKLLPVVYLLLKQASGFWVLGRLFIADCERTRRRSLQKDRESRAAKK